MKTLILTVLVAIGVTTSSTAATIDSIASAEILTSGIRQFNGGVSQAFFNSQGDDDTFARYAVVDFDSSTLGLGTVAAGDISVFSLNLTQSLAGFSTDGTLEFFLADDVAPLSVATTAAFQSSGDPLNPNAGAAVVGNGFGNLFSLGTGDFAQTANGDLDTFALTLDPASEGLLISQINNGGLIRILATPSGDASVAATYSGFDSLLTPPSPPTLTVESATAVPEPTSMVVLGCLVTGGIVRSRRRRSLATAG